MGLFSNWFSSKPDFPALDPNSRAMQRVHEVEHELNELAGKVSDKLEIIPSEHAAYVFIGKPPKSFGLAWIHDGEVSGLNTLVEEHGFSPAEVEKVIDELRAAYEHHTSDARYCVDLERRTIVVTPSLEFEQEVHEIVERITHH